MDSKNNSGRYNLNTRLQGKGFFLGLSKREYFAAMALQGLLSNKGPLFPDSQGNKELFAIAALKYADALIAELEKEGE